MRYIVLTFSALSLCVYVAMAQETPVNLLQKSITKTCNYRHLSFEAFGVYKNLFSDRDTTITSSKETIIQDGHGSVMAQNIIKYTKGGQPIFRNIYIKDKLYSLNIKDSTYSMESRNGKINNSINDYLNQLTYAITNKAKNISRQKDTMINRVSCYSFFVRSYDTVENNNHNYTYQYFYISKKTMLPVFVKEIGSGSAEKGGYSLGRVNVFNETYFNHYKLNKAPDPSIFTFNRNGFDLENKTMLAEGSAAPQIQVRHLRGNMLPPDNFKNKVVLLAFGSTTCAANPLANPVMNRLLAKYKANDVLIVGIYSEETPEQVKNYIQANDITFPVYLGSSRLKKKFKTIGTPNFYLIDKRGVVVKSIEGYSDTLEEVLTTALNQATATVKHN